MHNVKKSLNILSKFCGAHTAKFESMFGYFSLICMKRCLPAGIYLLKVNNKKTRARYEICSKLTIKTRYWRRSGVFIVNFDDISHLLLVFLLLTLNV